MFGTHVCLFVTFSRCNGWADHFNWVFARYCYNVVSKFVTNTKDFSWLQMGLLFLFYYYKQFCEVKIFIRFIITLSMVTWTAIKKFCVLRDSIILHTVRSFNEVCKMQEYVSECMRSSQASFENPYRNKRWRELK